MFLFNCNNSSRNVEESQVRSEQVRLFYKASFFASLASLVSGVILSVFQWPVVDHRFVLIWVFCLVLLVIARGVSYFAYFSAKGEGDQKAGYWERLAVAISIIAAIVWGIAGVMLFPSGDFQRQAGTVIILAGIAAGSATVLSALRLPYLIFLPTTLLPLAFNLFSERTEITSYIGVMCLVYLAFLMATAARIYETHLQNISLRIKSINEEKAIRTSEATIKKTAAILELIAKGEPASNIYHEIALLYESRYPGMRCSMLILHGNKLLHGGAPSLPKAYCEAVHGLENGPMVGSCGTSTYTGERVIVEDIATDPKWSALKDIALEHGLRCCWSEPIKDSTGRVLGAFGMYYDYPATPTQGQLIDMEAAAQLAGIALERENRERLLHQKNKMEAVGYMAGGMAHNFNNNLAIILGNVELAKLRQSGSQEVNALLENATIAVERSKELIMKIITYSRKGPQLKKPILLRSVVDETLTLLRSTLPTTIKLNVNVASGSESSYINADFSQVQEVLINLCNNAIHAMKEKGTLSIELSPVSYLGRHGSNQHGLILDQTIQLRVTDTGCGIPLEHQGKIFDPFFSTKADHEGAGMGLATVQGIVAQHGGDIHVESFPERGTTFVVNFPVIEAPVPQKRKPADSPVVGGSENILFVDDDEMLVDLGQTLLSEQGYRVTGMTNSEKALAVFQKDPFAYDLVVTDQTMPALSGTDLAQEMLRLNPDLPIVLCTGYSTQVDETVCEDFGLCRYLMKPLNMTELLKTVRSVLDEKKPSQVI